MTHSPPLPALTLRDYTAHVRLLLHRAARRPVTLSAGDLEALLALVAAVELTFGPVPAVTGEGAA